MIIIFYLMVVSFLPSQVSYLKYFPLIDRYSRSCSSVIRTRSLFSSAENNATNKRPAAICEFFAKGWCIRGTSCKFLHVKDDVNNTNQLHEGHVTAATVEREEPVNRGKRYFLLCHL